MYAIPKSAREAILPNPALNIISFIRFPTPNIRDTNLTAKQCTSAEPPTNESLRDISLLDSPPPELVHQLSEIIKKDPNIQSIILPYDDIAFDDRFPLWLVTFWTELIPVRTAQKSWAPTVSKLKQRRKLETALTGGLGEVVVDVAYEALQRLEWGGVINGFPIQIEKRYLASFFTNDWLSSDHLDLLLNLTRSKIAASELRDIVELPSESALFIPKIKQAYHRQDSYPSPTFRWLHQTAGKLTSRHKTLLGTLANVNDNHWVTIVIDTEQAMIFHGDSMGHDINDTLGSALRWWTYQHFGVNFRVEEMMIERQTDSYSCGLLAWDALEHFLLDDRESLIDSGRMYVHRLNTFLEIITRHNDQTFTSISQTSAADIDSSDSSSNHSVRFHSDEERISDGGSDEDSDDGEFEGSDKDSDNGEVEGSESALEASDSDSEELEESKTCSGGDSNDGDDNCKRCRLNSTPSNYPAASSPHVQLAGEMTKQKKSVTSSTRRALEKLKGTASPVKRKAGGILNFLKPCTLEERRQHVTQENEKIKMTKDNKQLRASKKVTSSKLKLREQVRVRQQRKREKKKKVEIASGIRSPGGRKQKMVELKDHGSKQQKTSVAELSRPKRQLKPIFASQNRKPQGRKRTKPIRKAKYTHWQAPFLWDQIDDAAKEAGFSASRIVKLLQSRHEGTFDGLNESTIRGGRKGILSHHPDVVKAITSRLQLLCDSKAPISVITARGIMLATIADMTPALLSHTFKDGSTFQASESFVRAFMHSAMKWSPRKGTHAAHKLPEDWEEQLERSFLRKVFAIKEEDMLPEFIVNSDQTNVIYAPGDKMTWGESGAKQVELLGGEEKRAFTVMVSVCLDGRVLPFQAIYSGKTKVSCPSPSSPSYDKAISAGFQFEPSGTSTYWSNHETMHTYVNNILAPHFSHAKAAAGRPESQKTLWMLDVWSVQRSEAFRHWMAVNHPTIILDYVPGGCTPVGQPCDVGMQHPFKLAVKKSYQEDVVNEALEQIQKGEKSAFSNCKFCETNPTDSANPRSWNYSWDSLSSYEARAKLRDIQREDPDFYASLIRPEPLSPDDEDIPEDKTELDGDEGDDGVDIPLEHVLAQILTGEVADTRFTANEAGGLVSRAEAETLEDVEVTLQETADGEETLGKRKRKANVLYNANEYWHH
ncbi:hypothetical protein D9758_018984 [Tetrapyrgos nigripes]|uniref:Ubiquitin-like protease family profile domain-containing protein n=1 Tax=Tetrapyrgos nigripes TaxID=182062 RepID=A0A8H5F4A7_9AGAR|nr:hypothetical protein D9758_018984 [Tetrapyrgos nigripes]